MRIGFDAKRLYNNFTGLGNYSRFVVEALSVYFPNHKYLLFTPKIKSNSDTQFFLESKNIQTILPAAWIGKLNLKSFWRSFMISDLASKAGIEIYHGLSHELPKGISKRTKTVVTVHDLIFLRYPQFYNWLDILIYKAKIRHACQVADRIIAISDQTRHDVIEFLKIDPKKIRVVYQGCHANFMRVPDQQELSYVQQKYKLPDAFILNVGTIEPRKNALTIVKALPMLKNNKNVTLVIIGKATKYSDDIKIYIKKYALEKQILFIHHVDFKDLPAIYRLSKVFVYPSLFEGFGIPLVEAIACGVPVITSTGSCFTEAAGPHSIYVDPENPEALAYQIDRLLSDQALSNQITTLSLQYIAQFSPSIIADKLMTIYSELIS